MKKFMSLIMIPCLTVFLISCGETEFSATAEKTNTDPVSEPKTITINYERDINTTANVDMIWVVDNSTSMTEEVEIIRKNLGDFLLKLEDRAKLNFTLITSATSGNGMSLSNWALAKGYRQIPQYINSRDGLIKLLELAPKLINTGIRANSKKIVVMVTDDNSDLSSSLFTKGLSKLFNFNDFKIFGFVGLSKELSPCIDYAGNQYIKLAEMTMGQTFNICESDWSPYFASIVSDVAKITKTEFTLPSRIQGEIVVKIDGQVITKYILNDRTLIIHPENFPVNKKYDIEVTYLPQK
jgi:23S rRNA pseudoU1915 N3-methylase RlmH